MDDLIRIAKIALRASPARWNELARSFPAELLRRAPLPGEWSAAQCLQHLIEGERLVFPVRVKAFLTGQDIADFDPEAQTAKALGTPAELAEEFARLRKANLRLLEGVTQADLAHESEHSALGKVNLREMINEWVAHDLMHIVQAERAVMQPFIAAAGAWRMFFTDHDVEATIRR
jgi:hypothetical protein